MSYAGVERVSEHAEGDCVSVFSHRRAITEAEKRGREQAARLLAQQAQLLSSNMELNWEEAFNQLRDRIEDLKK